MSELKIAVTGANGLVGSELCRHLAKKGVTHRPLCRSGCNNLPPHALVVDYHSRDQLEQAFKDCNCVIHLIARTHSSKDERMAAEYHAVNVELTKKVARSAAQAKIRKIVYLSSIKVNGEQTYDKPFSAADRPNPVDIYGKSKLAAELELSKECTTHGINFTILRSPLVYSPEAGGNIKALITALRHHIPMPLASIENHRSIVELGDLCEQLRLCASLPQTSNKTLLACSQTISTPELIRKLAHDEGLRPLLFRCPPGALRVGAQLLGKTEQWQRLAGDLVIDDSQTRNLLQGTKGE